MSEPKLPDMKIDPLAIPTPGLDYKTKRFAIASGRSWWQARYRGGRVLSEWDTMRVDGDPSSTRWEDASQHGMIALRLVCPNGNAGVLENPPGDYHFFQLKGGHFDLGAGKGIAEAHIIGMVLADGDSVICWAWETHNKRLVRFQDHFSRMVYGGVGALSANTLGVRL